MISLEQGENELNWQVNKPLKGAMQSSPQSGGTYDFVLFCINDIQPEMIQIL